MANGVQTNDWKWSLSFVVFLSHETVLMMALRDIIWQAMINENVASQESLLLTWINFK